MVGNHHFHPFKTGCLGYQVPTVPAPTPAKIVPPEPDPSLSAPVHPRSFATGHLGSRWTDELFFFQKVDGGVDWTGFQVFPSEKCEVAKTIGAPSLPQKKKWQGCHVWTNQPNQKQAFVLSWFAEMTIWGETKTCSCHFYHRFNKLHPGKTNEWQWKNNHWMKMHPPKEYPPNRKVVFQPPFSGAMLNFGGVSPTKNGDVPSMSC